MFYLENGNNLGTKLYKDILFMYDYIMITPHQFFKNLKSKYYDEHFEEYKTDIACIRHLSHKEQKKIMDEVNGISKMYYYMLTFTLDPKKNELNDDLYDVVETYIKKQMTRKALDLRNVYLVREGGDEEHKHVHWHVSVKCPKILKKGRFNYYEKLYGKVDLQGSKVYKTQEEAINYMSKQSTPILL